jgi:flagellar FliJ protein
MPRFRFRLEQVLDHRSRREDLMRQELAQAIAAVAAQQERALAAERAVEDGLDALRAAMASPSEVHSLRARHEELAFARTRAAHERHSVSMLEAVAEERRADLVRASQDREALVQLKGTALERHRQEELRREGIALDELATRRAGRARAAVTA